MRMQSTRKKPVLPLCSVREVATPASHVAVLDCDLPETLRVYTLVTCDATEQVSNRVSPLDLGEDVAGSKFQPDRRDLFRKPGVPGIRTPVEGESSSNDNVPIPDATLIDSPLTPVDPEATMVDADATMVDVAKPPSSPRGNLSGFVATAAVLEPGDVLGERYEIQQLLGEGGMGAVYKAKDRELGRFVALKVIRPELAASPAILARFKQELLLAHQVTHKNVIRIYDLSEANGVKFITMEFVEGEDLRGLMQKNEKFSPQEAVEIMMQTCRGLEAAHSVGIIHRDLKPQNIMRDKAGRILVMDFGLARTLEGDGMTQTGALVGTMDYMSPEQALGKDLDQRSDVFALGLIFYELLSGKMPYKADSAVASLLKRTKERAAPVSSHNASIPGPLSNIVGKCMEPDVKLRYQSAGEILADLEVWQGGRAAATLRFPSGARPWGQTIPWQWFGAVATVLVLASVGFLLRDKLVPRTASQQPAEVKPDVSLAILPFRNASGDTSLDWLGSSLAQMLTTDVGQSAHLRTVSPDQLHQVLRDLHIGPDAPVDPTMLRRISEFTKADTVVWGQYVRAGDQIRIDATVRDLKHERTASLKAEAEEKSVPTAVDRLAESIRQNLALAPNLVKELQSHAFKPTSASLDALRDYNQGLELMRQGNSLEAVKRFRAATNADAQFAWAYSRLGEGLSALGHDDEAEQASRQAVELSQNLPLSERYFIEASRARVVHDKRKAIEAYENLAKSFPDDLDVKFALGGLYEDNADFDKARTYYKKVLNTDPKNLVALLSMGSVEIGAGDPERALTSLGQAISLAKQVDNKQEEALILQATGIAYGMMNKPDEALRNYQQSLEINRKLGEKRGVAASLVQIGVIQEARGQPKAALSSLSEALNIRREIGAKKQAGDTLVELGSLYLDGGQYDRALQMYKESLQIQRDAGDETNQAVCLHNIGSAKLLTREYPDAITYFQEALQLRQKLNVPQDIAETVQNLAAAYSDMGQYDEAISYYMRALDLNRKAGDNRAAAIQSADIAEILDTQGRYGAAVNAMQDAVNTLHQTGDRGGDVLQILSAYALALAHAGRETEAQKQLQEAQAIARELKNESAAAQLLNVEGDILFFRSDFKQAGSLYRQAAQLALRRKDREQEIIARLNLDKVSIAEGSPRAAINDLNALAQQADSLGLKYLSVSSVVYRAEALVDAKDFARAGAELQKALGQAENLGLRMEMAKIHYLQGTSLRMTGHASEAGGQYRETLRLMDEMQKDPGAQDLMHRSDLHAIYTDVTQFLQSAAKVQ
jgi:eukaryotic-like serine/threonine-protein kinase